MFDALTAHALAVELNETLARGRVQSVIPLDELRVGFEIYARQQRHYLLLSADPTGARIHLATDKLRAAATTLSPFLLLLRKYAHGAFVNQVEAVPLERIIRIEFDHAEQGISTLVAEIMGRHSNVILLDASDEVLDSIKRVTPQMSRARTVQPSQKYQPPPPQQKLDPLAVRGEELRRLLSGSREQSLWRILVQNFAGTSPLLARELAFRVEGDVDAKCDPALAERLRAEIAKVWHALAEPTVAYDDGEPSAVAAFALSHLPNTRRFASMSAALEEYFGAMETYEAVKAPLRRQLEAARERLEHKRRALERELSAASNVEQSRMSGELILAYINDIRPGQKSLRAELVADQPIEIPLDPKLTPVENAQKYFAKYRHARDAAKQVPERLREVQADLAFSDQVLADLDAAESRVDIEAVVAEAHEAGLLGGRSKQRDNSRTAPSIARTAPRSYISPDGFQVLVGRNARQNDEVTFRRAAPDDLWLHARGAAGAHVVILSRGRAVPESTVEFAAALAANFSQARNESWTDVAVAPRKNVRRVPGRAARPGLVTVRGERTVRVQPSAAQLAEEESGEARR